MVSVFKNTRDIICKYSHLIKIMPRIIFRSSMGRQQPLKFLMLIFLFI